MFVDGAWAPARGTGRNPVTDPATGEVWGSVPDGIDRGRGRRRRLPPAARSSRTVAATGAVRARRVPAADRRRGGEAGRGAVADQHPGERLPGVRIRAAPRPTRPASSATSPPSPAIWSTRTCARSRAAAASPWCGETRSGVCALIAPWNFPINLVVIKLAPALLAGCTVVMKPASPTPLSLRLIIDAVAAAGVPAGVVNLVTGSGRLGDALVQAPRRGQGGVHRVDAGGPENRRRLRRTAAAGHAGTGRKVQRDRAAGRRPGRDVQGADPLLHAQHRADLLHLHPDPGPGHPLRRGGGHGHGHHRRRKQGDPLDPDTVFGPCATESQYRTVLEYVESGHGRRRPRHHRRAARRRLGGGLEGGYFVRTHRLRRRHAGDADLPGGDLRPGDFAC